MFGENKDAVGMLDHFFGQGFGAINGKIDAVPRLDYFADALVGLTAEFTPFFGNATRLYSEIWPSCSERFGADHTRQFVLRANEKQ